jgi:hypothetical protein
LIFFVFTIFLSHNTFNYYTKTTRRIPISCHQYIKLFVRIAGSAWVHFNCWWSKSYLQRSTMPRLFLFLLIYISRCTIPTKTCDINIRYCSTWTKYVSLVCYLLVDVVSCKTSLKIQNILPKEKGQAIICKTPHRSLKIEQDKPH